MSHVGAGARGQARDQGGYKSPSGFLRGSPLPDQSASTGAPYVRLYVSQQREKGKGQVRDRLARLCAPGHSATRQTRRLCRLFWKKHAKKVCQKVLRNSRRLWRVWRLWPTPAYESAVRLWTLRVAGGAGM